ncbi:hypothetical protein CHRYSEO8AT_20082 [Chryseobacterium sp. 8AT]|nr:hypothetical protein CHRYSEO8AT_20082 [Chryseobacterium sp. 8AT]
MKFFITLLTVEEVCTISFAELIMPEAKLAGSVTTHWAFADGATASISAVHTRYNTFFIVSEFLNC